MPEAASKSPNVEPSPPRTIGGRFELRASLGAAPNRRTFLAEDLERGGSVVVKLVPLHSQTAGALARLEYESTFMQRLACDRFSQVLFAGRDGNDLAIVFEHVAGIALSDRLRAQPLDVDETLVVARSLFTALRDIHLHGMLHRGVRPSNAIVNGDGPLVRATLTDFGPATSLSLASDERPEESIRGAVYMSPEEAGSIHHDTAEASDLYSAGATLFHCLAGRPPFHGASLGSLLLEHMTAPVPELRKLGVAAPRALDEVIQRLLRKDPRDRYRSAAGVLADLDEISAALARGEVEPDLAIGANDVRDTLAEPAFVARQGELAALEVEMSNTCRGKAGVVLLEAESGGGKSRLLTEIAHRARRRGFWTLWGQGVNEVAREPLSLLKGVIEGFLSAAELQPDLIGRVRERLGDQAAAVTAVLPGLAAALGPCEIAAAGPEAAGELRVVHALGTFLSALGTAERPVLLILDDCQWADDLTLRLIRRWQALTGGEGGPQHLLTVAGFRSEEVGENHPLRQVPGVVRLRLAPLSPEETQRLVESMAGALPRQAVEAVTRLAEGSPFMASAVLRGFVESGTLVHEASGWRLRAVDAEAMQSSRRAADVLARRLDLLPDDSLRLLSVAAVLGKDFELDIAAELAGHDVPRAIAAIDAARARRLVWLRADGATCAFVHDKIRSALLDRHAPPDLQALHARVARLLLDGAAPRDADVAYHLDAAGDPRSALPYALRAAEQARAQCALEAAEQQYCIAVRGSDGAHAGDRFLVAARLGETRMLRGDYDGAAREFAIASSFAQGPYDQAKIRTHLGELAMKRGDMAGAIAAFEDALRRLGRFVPASWPVLVAFVLWEGLVQALHTCLPRLFVHRRRWPPGESERLTLRLLSNLAHGCWYCRSMVHVMWSHLRGLNIAERYPPTAELAQAYAEHAPGLTLLGLTRRARAYAQKSLELRRELGDLWGQGQSLHYHGVVLYADSQYAQCVEKCREAVRLLARTGDFWQVHIARYQVAAALYRLGDLAGAADECRLNYNSGIELGDEQASGIILDVWVRASGQAVPAAILEEELARPRPDAQGQAQVLFANGLHRLETGQCERAAVLFGVAADVARAAGVRNAYTLQILPWLATALRRQAAGLRDHTRRRRDRLLRRAARAARRACHARLLCANDLPHAWRELGLILAMQGKVRRAARYLDRSMKLARRQNARIEFAQSLLARAELGEESNWPGAAADRAEAQSLLGELHVGARSDSSEGASAEPVSLSLADRFDSVLDWGRRIASALDAAAIHEAARAAALRLLRAEDCVVLGVEDRGGERRFIPLAGAVPGGWSVEHLDEAIAAGKSLALRDVEARGQAAHVGVEDRSALCAPLFSRGVVVACLYVTHEGIRGLFDIVEERLADFIAAIAGAALDNAEGFALLHRMNDTLERRVAERTSLIETRSRDLARSNQELERMAGELLAAKHDLTIAKQAAEAASEAKSRFLASMSHEIRTPMNGVIGMTELALRTALTVQQRGYLSTVLNSAKALLALLSDILDFSRIEAGRMEVESVPLCLADVIVDAARLMAVQASAKGLEVTCKLDANVPEIVLGDPGRLRQIVVNLVGNAVKFTARGEVYVRVSCRPDSVGVAALCIAVQDTGIGIPVDKRQVVFEAFRQGDTSIARRFGGSGLGLAISSQLVSLMGGRLWVESEPGRGSTFQFAIPLRLPAEPGAQPSGPALAGQALVLCVNRHAQEAYAATLATLGLEAVALAPWDAAIPDCCDATDGQPAPVVAVVDVAATDALEWDIVDLWRRHAMRCPPIVAIVSPSVEVDAAGQCARLGISQCLTKPVKPRELAAAVESALGMAARLVEAAAEPPNAALRGLRVLVADDCDVNLEVASGLLELRGCVATTVKSGEAALELAERESFDAILMDVEMEGMDGLATTAALRLLERPLGTRSPVIALTAHAVEGFEQRCREAGMDACIAKPVQPDMLYRVLERLCLSHDPAPTAR